MCSFIVTSKQINDLNYINYYSKNRGPDNTSMEIINNVTLVHNLLSITGILTKQPLNKNGVYLVYNGEIYNYKSFGNYSSDGYCILDCYISEKINGLKKIDGEFSFCLYDTNFNKIIFGVDAFCTKPCYYSFENDKFGISSYKSNLERLNFKQIKKINPNTIIEYDLNFKNIQQHCYYEFNLNQYKNSYDDWCIAFDESVKKRYHSNLKPLVPMSSGYDSGAICCSLNKNNFDYISFTINGKENLEIIKQRLNQNINNIKYQRDFCENKNNVKTKMIEMVEPFFYGPNPETITHTGLDDPGAMGLFTILSCMKQQHDTRIVFSGQGSDEIMGNIQTYGFKTKNPQIFPSNLSTIFPYGNFYYGAQSSYLMKEECIGGSLGIETRYPFLDKKLVQEFLNLSNTLKNFNYKAPLHHYFKVNNYPFAEKEKVGFQI